MKQPTSQNFQVLMAGTLGLLSLAWAPNASADLRPTADSATQQQDVAPALQVSPQTQPVSQQANTLAEEMIGGIDWENSIVYAVGDGVPPPDAINPAQARVRAKRAAIDEAMARLLETIKEVRVDAESTTRDFINENRMVSTRVSGLVKHSEVVEIRQAEDGSYQVKMAMPLGGPNGLSAVLLPLEMHKAPTSGPSTVATPPVAKVAIASVTKRTLPMHGEVSADSSAAAPQQVTAPSPAVDPGDETSIPHPAPATEVASPYSSLIIDARGLGAAEAMYPRILTRSGKVLYDIRVADPNAMLGYGGKLCAYKKSIDSGKGLPRAGANPLVIKASDVSGTSGVDLVIGDDEGERVASANSETGFLAQANVIVVTD